MDQKWKIIYYKTSQGTNPVYNFISSLDEKTKSKVIDTVDLLEEFGVRLGLPHVKKLAGTSFWELRILGSNNIRVLYVAAVDKTFLLLHGFQKKKQKTDKREIKIATHRLKEYARRTK